MFGDLFMVLVYVNKNKFKIFRKKPSYGKYLSRGTKSLKWFTYTTNNPKQLIGVVPKKGVLDPQGSAVKKALQSLGFDELEDVRIGKYININFSDNITGNIEEKIEDMCNKLLVNKVIEDFFYKIEGE